MQGSERLALMIESRTRGNEEIERLTKALNTFVAAIEKSSRKTSAATAKANKHGAALESAATKTDAATAKVKKHGAALKKTSVNYAALTAAAIAYGAALKILVIDTAKTAARAQTLGIVIDSLAKANNLNRDAVRAQVIEVRKLGISTLEAKGIIAKMIVAQLDLRKANELARLSQHAATIAGIDSSQAFAGILDGILTRQIRVLRTYGINVTFMDKFAAASKRLGHELTAQQKTQVALAAVLEQLPKLMGTYEAGMTTAGKQMTSLTRHFQDAKVAIGEGMIPVLGKMVHLLERTAKAAQANSRGFAMMVEGGAALGVALGVARFTPGGPIAKVLAGGAAGLGTFALANSVDPVEYYKGQGERTINAIRARQAKINERLKSGDIGADEGAAEFRALDESINTIRKQTIELIAKAVRGDWEKYLKTRGSSSEPLRSLTAFGYLAHERATGKAFAEGKAPLPVPQTFTIAGVTITSGEIVDVLTAPPPAPGEGPLLNVEALDAARRAEAAAKAAAAAAKKAEAFAKARLEFVKQMGEYYRSRMPTVFTLNGKQYAIGQQRPATDMDIQSLEYMSSRSTVELGMKQFALGQFPQRNANAEAKAFEKTTANLGPRKITKMMMMRFDLLRQTTELEARRIELIAGPGGEVAAVEKVMKLRLGFLDKMKKAGFDQFELDQERMQIITNYEINLLELRRRGIEEYKQSVVSMFDALIAGGQGGFSAFLKSQGLGMARQVVGNLAEEAYRPGLLTLPGQGSASKPNFLGKILSGTPLGLDPATRATDENTIAIIANTKAQLLREFGGGTAERYSVGGVFQGSSGPLGTIFSALSGKGGGGAADSTIDLGGYFGQFGLGKSAGSGMSPLKGVGVAGAGVAGTLGVLAGIKQGGARGALTAGASGAGAAGALIAMLAPATGPLAPVLIGLGLGLGAAGGFLPDPKKHRAEQIDLRIEKAQITVEGPTEFRLTGGGQGFDYNFLNQPRVFVIDNSGGNGGRMSEDEAADLVRGAIQRGHPINDEMRSAVLGI